MEWVHHHVRDDVCWQHVHGVSWFLYCWLAGGCGHKCSWWSTVLTRAFISIGIFIIPACVLIPRALPQVVEDTDSAAQIIRATHGVRGMHVAYDVWQHVHTIICAIHGVRGMHVAEYVLAACAYLDARRRGTDELYAQACYAFWLIG